MSSKKILSTCVILFFLSTLLMAMEVHPFYLSVTEIEYFPKDRRLGISIKVFSDDIENAINENRKPKTDIIKGSKAQNNPLLKSYILNHFSISIDGQKKDPSFLGYELDRDAIWIYLEINAQSQSPKNLAVNSDILYDQHEEQINIIHTVINGVRSSKKLNFPEHLCLFKY